MKTQSNIRKFFLTGSIAALLASPSGDAATIYWDSNGTTAGFGTATGTWDGAGTVGSGTQGWGTDITGLIAPTGTITTLSTNATTDALNFGTATAGLSAGTITVAGTVQAGAITFGAASGAIVLSGGTAINLTAASTITVNNATNTIDTAITGAATSFTKAGSGILVLTGTNTYSGATTISAGTLQVSTLANAGSNSNLGNFATAGATGILLSGGRLQYTGASGVSVNRGFTVTATSTVDINAASTSLTLGASSMAASTLNVTSGGTGSRLGLGALALTGAAVLNPTTANLTVASISSVAAQNLTLGGTSSDNTVTGAIATLTGTLTKNTASTWTLSGVNGYTGATSVTGGILRVDGSTHATSTMGVSAGALGGVGTVNGVTTISGTGGINLANGSVGGTPLTIANAGTFGITGAAGANNLSFDLASAGSTTDKISVTGTTTVTTDGAAVIIPNQIGGSGNRINNGTYTLIGGAGTLDATNFAKFRLATTKAFGMTFALSNPTGDGGGDLALTTTQVAGAVLTNTTLTGTAPSWQTSGNFSGAAVPDYQSNVIINTAIGASLLNGSTNINSLTFGTSATTAVSIGAGTATAGTPASMLVIEAGTHNSNTAGNGITLSNTSGTHTISANVGLAATQTWTVATGAGLAVSGVISDFGGGYGLTKEGGGTLTLSGVNTFSGPLTIANGTVRADSSTLGNKGGNGLLGAGATLVMGGSGTTGRLAVQQDNPGPTIDKDITLATGGTGEFQFGNTSFPAFTITNTDRPMTLSGNISGSGNFTKLGGSAIVLTGNNTYTGTTTINEGPLRLSSATALPGGIGATGGTSALTINGNNITNTGNVGAVVALTAASGDFLRALGTGADQFQITGGVSGFEAFGSARQVIVGNDAAFELQWGIATFNPSALLLGYNSVTATGALTLQNKIDLNAATRTIQVNTGAATSTISGVIRTSSGTAGLTKTGGGTLALTGSNTYNGPTTVTAGTLQLGNGGTTGSLNTSGVISVGSGATFAVNQTDTVTQGTDFSAAAISGSGGFTQAGSGTTILNLANTYTGPTTISAGILQLNAGGVILTPILNNATFTANSAGALTQGTHFGMLGGTGTVIQGGAGALTLNLANIHTGDTRVNAGTIVMGNTLALQNSAFDTASINGGLVVTGFTTPTLGGLTGSVNLSSTLITGYGSITNLTLNPQSGIIKTYTGDIANGAANMILTKTGAGTQILQGPNTYSGATNIIAGTLTLSGASGSIASTTINLNGGGLTLDNTTNLGTRVDNAADITVNASSALTFTHGAAASTNYLETIETLTLAAGTLTYTGTQAAATGTSILTFTNALAQSGTATANFTGTGLGTNSRNRILFTGQAVADLGPWAVVNSADFATYNATEGVQALVSSTLAINSNSSTTNYNSNGASITFDAALTPSLKTLLINSATVRTIGLNSNTVSVGGISSTGATHIISGTGAVQALTAGDSLYVNVGANTLQFDSVIQNVGAGATPTTLVKSGGGTLTLTNAGNTYSGGTVINGGTFVVTADGQLGAAGGDVTINGNVTWSRPNTSGFTFGSGRDWTINEGATLTLSTGNAGQNFDGILQGSGTLTNPSTTGYAFRNTGNTFTGTVNSGYQMSFASIGDSANAFNLVGSNANFIWTGVAKAFALRPLTLNAAGPGNFNNDGSGAVTFAQDLAFSGAAGARTLGLGGTYTGGVNVFSGNIADGPGSVVSLTKSGAGIWALTNANTYTGATTLSAGTLALTNANAIQNSALTVSGGTLSLLHNTNNTTFADTSTTFSAGATINVNNNGSGTGNTLKLGAVGVSAATTATLTVTNSNSYVLGLGALTQTPATGTTLTIANAAPMTIASYATNSTTGTARLTFTGAGNATITGNITQNGANALGLDRTTAAGTLILQGTSNMTGSVTITSGTIQTAVATNAFGNTSGISIGGGGILALRGDSSAAFSNGTTNYPVALTATGATINVDQASSATAGTTLTLGTVAMPGAYTLNTTGANGVSLALGAVTGSTANNKTINNTIASPGGLTLASYAESDASARTITLQGTGYTTVTGAITQNGANALALTKNGTGTVALGGTNTYTGLTTVIDGVLRLNSANALPGGIATSGGTGALTLNNGILGLGHGDFTRALGAGANQVSLSGATSGFAAFGADRTVNIGGAGGPLAFNGANFVTSSFVLSHSTADATIILANSLNLGGGGRSITVNNGSALVDARITGDLTNSNGFTKNGTGFLQLTGTKTYTGSLTISAGTLELGNNTTTGSFTGLNATITNNAELSINRSDAFTQAAGLNNQVIGGSGSFTQAGSGTTTLSLDNTYTGATTVNAGSLLVNGSISGSSGVTVNGGILGGTGSISGAVAVQSGGTLAAGSSIESLATGALSFNGGSTFAYELNNDAAPGVAGDLTAITGSFTLAAANTTNITFTELGAGSWSAGEKLTLASYSGTWNGGLFNFGSVVADDSTISFSGTDWTFNYNDTVAGSNFTSDLTGPNYVTITAVPEPGAVMSLLAGMGVLAFVRRRRR